MGLFLTFEEPSGPMKKEAATAGFYEPVHFLGRGVPKLQILTIFSRWPRRIRRLKAAPTTIVVLFP